MDNSWLAVPRGVPRFRRGLEGGRKPFYDVLLAAERRCCDCTGPVIWARPYGPWGPNYWLVIVLSARFRYRMGVYGVRLRMCVLEQLKGAKWDKGLSVSWVSWVSWVFVFVGLEQHRKREGIASFFGIIALGCRSRSVLAPGAILAQDWYVCRRRYWISAKRAPAKLHQNCLTFATTCLGMLLLSFCFGES